MHVVGVLLAASEVLTLAHSSSVPALSTRQPLILMATPRSDSKPCVTMKKLRHEEAKTVLQGSQQGWDLDWAHSRCSLGPPRVSVVWATSPLCDTALLFSAYCPPREAAHSLGPQGVPCLPWACTAMRSTGSRVTVSSVIIPTKAQSHCHPGQMPPTQPGSASGPGSLLGERASKCPRCPQCRPPLLLAML